MKAEVELLVVVQECDSTEAESSTDDGYRIIPPQKYGFILNY